MKGQESLGAPIYLQPLLPTGSVGRWEGTRVEALSVVGSVGTREGS